MSLTKGLGATRFNAAAFYLLQRSIRRSNNPLEEGECLLVPPGSPGSLADKEVDVADWRSEDWLLLCTLRLNAFYVASPMTVWKFDLNYRKSFWGRDV